MARTGRPPLAEPGYDAVHVRLRKAHGKAREHTCVECGQPAREWSLDCYECTPVLTDDKGRKYTTDLAAYVPRCWPCHRQHDVDATGRTAQHGTRSRANRGCRCDPCRAAVREYSAQYRAAHREAR